MRGWRLARWLQTFASALLIILLVAISPHHSTAIGAGGWVVESCADQGIIPALVADEGALTGRITDAASGAGIFALVTISGGSALLSGKTTAQGNFAVVLASGSYDVAVRSRGFQESSATVAVRTGRTTRLHLALKRFPASSGSRADPSPSETPSLAQAGCPPWAWRQGSPGQDGRPASPGFDAGASSPGTPGGSSGIGGLPSGGGGGGTGGGGSAGGGGASSPGADVTTPPGGESTPAATQPPAPPTTPSGGSPWTQAGLTLVRTMYTGHGNAARTAWSDDGKTVFLANEEGIMSAVKIDVGDPNKPKIAATDGSVNFLWAAAQRQGLLVFHPSLDGYLSRYDPQTFKLVWTKLVGIAHAVETDGTRIFLPVEGKPANLMVFSASGAVLSQVPVAEGWWRVYAMSYDESTGRLYVGAESNTSQGIPGGIYIFNASGAPVLQGKIPGSTGDMAARGNKVWRQIDTGIEAWDVSNPASPTLTGTWMGQVVSGPGGTLVRPQLQHMAVNSAGTRLYVNFRTVTAAQGNQVLDWDAGFKIFNTSGPSPIPIASQGWKTATGLWVQPISIALSPDGSKVAVSYWAFGVGLYGVLSDQISTMGRIPTTGEGHDVYVDNAGFVHVFANDDIQIFDPNTGSLTGYFISGQGFDGQWRPFRDGTIILPSARNGSGRLILRIQDGAVTYVTSLGGAASTWDEVFEDPWLYSGTDQGLLVQSVGAFNTANGKYPLTLLGSVTVGGKLLAITKSGNLVWGLGPQVGVVAIDVSNPAAPKVVYQDKFSFGVNGNHAGIVAARGRVYAGAGDAGVIVYSVQTLKRVGQLTGLNANFMDRVGEDFIVVSNYWYTKVMEGMVIFDIRQNADIPTLLTIFPGDAPNANFRARVIGNRIYRVPLYGADILDFSW